MARLEGLFQNRTALTIYAFAILAVLAAYKTVQTESVQGGLQGHIPAQSLQLAQDLMRTKPRKPDAPRQENFISDAGYGLVIAALAALDHKLKNALPCHKRTNACDPMQFKSLFAVQYAVAVAGLIAIFLLAWVLSRAWSVALLTLISAFVAGSYGGLAGQLSPLAWLQTLMLLFLVFVALAATRDDVRWTLVAGITLGCGVLFSPQLLLIGIISVMSFLLLGRGQHLDLAQPGWHAGALAFGITCVMAAVSIVLPFAELKSLIWQQVIHHASERFDLKRDALSFILSTPEVFMRGLWVGTPFLTVLGLVHLPSLLKFSREDARLGPTLLVAIPIVSLVVINTLVTGNRPDYNVGLVFLLCYATAYLIGRTEVRRKFWKDRNRAAHMP